MDILETSTENSTLLDELEADRLNLTQLYTITPLFVILLIVGLIGNLVICVVIASRKPMHTTMNFYLFSLALSDILILLVNVTRSLFDLWTEVYNYWYEFCYYLICESVSNASVLTVTVLSVERYLAICHPLYKKCFMSDFLVVKRCIIGIWIVSIFVAVIMSVVGNYEIVYDKIYMIVSVGLFFVVPIILMSVFYANICLTITKYRYDINKKIDDNETKAIKILVAILLLFVICWTPFHIQRILVTYGAIDVYENNIFFVVSNLLYILSAVLNPVLYSLMSEKFRREFKIVFGKYLPSNQTQNEDLRNVSMSPKNTQISVET